MAGFRVVPITGLAVADWADPPTVDRAGRLGPQNPVPMRYMRYTGGTVRLDACMADELTHRDDATLGGAPFSWWWVEYPGTGPLSSSSPGGHSAQFNCTPGPVGHYAVAARKLGGGGVILHFEVEVES